MLTCVVARYPVTNCPFIVCQFGKGNPFSRRRLGGLVAQLASCGRAHSSGRLSVRQRRKTRLGAEVRRCDLLVAHLAHQARLHPGMLSAARNWPRARGLGLHVVVQFLRQARKILFAEAAAHPSHVHQCAGFPALPGARRPARCADHGRGVAHHCEIRAAGRAGSSASRGNGRHDRATRPAWPSRPLVPGAQSPRNILCPRVSIWST